MKPVTEESACLTSLTCMCVQQCLATCKMKSVEAGIKTFLKMFGFLEINYALNHENHALNLHLKKKKSLHGRLEMSFAWRILSPKYMNLRSTTSRLVIMNFVTETLLFEKVFPCDISRRL